MSALSKINPSRICHTRGHDLKLTRKITRIMFCTSRGIGRNGIFIVAGKDASVVVHRAMDKIKQSDVTPLIESACRSIIARAEYTHSNANSWATEISKNVTTNLATLSNTTSWKFIGGSFQLHNRAYSSYLYYCPENRHRNGDGE